MIVFTNLIKAHMLFLCEITGGTRCCANALTMSEFSWLMRSQGIVDSTGAPGALANKPVAVRVQLSSRLFGNIFRKDVEKS